ncbi:MAG: hypothetical protein HYX94_11510 [Chloroflexi bacterium]|nr:hypothetical protein [Chloroflexota bacterium]
MRHISLLLGIASIAALVVPLALPSLALAHERRTIGGGKYDAVVGFDKEPALVGQPNAAGIRLTRAGTQDPVEGMEKTLKVSIAFGGGAAKEFALRPVFGQKGYYVADVLPTKAGSYIFTFRGDIDGAPIDERFESGPGRFDDVKSTEALQLPQVVPDPVAMGGEVKAAREEAATARNLAVGGLVVGVAGLATGLAAVLNRRRVG